MAKPKYDGPLNRHMDFTHAGPNGEPASGLAVQNYIKGIDGGKVGVGYTLADGSAHLMFADAEDMLAYQQDPTRVELIKDVIELNNQLYNLNITLLSQSFVPVFLGSTGNYIRYTFNTTNRNDQPIAEPVTAVYTIMNGARRTVVTETYRAGVTVEFNLDKYLLEGENTVSIELRGQITHAFITTSVVYQAVNLQLEDSMDISTVYRQSGASPESLAVPYAVTGVGRKVMEWYIDGVQLAYVQGEDEITESVSERTKYINLAGYAQGKHTLQFRASLQVSGQTFYTDTFYREFILDNGTVGGDPVVVTAAQFPYSVGVLDPQDSLTIYAEQYVPYLMRLACWNPDATYRNTVKVNVGGVQVASIECVEGEESVAPITFSTSGAKVITLVVGETTVATFAASVAETSMDISEITNDLELAFSADGRSNSSANKDSWSDGTHSATFTGFKWNENSGWVDGKLMVPQGGRVAFDYAPLGVDPTALGKTLEFDLKTTNVDDDDAVLIDLMNANNIGIRITATQIIVRSRAGVEITRRFKSDEDLRISVVINRKAGATNQGLVFVYFNGILSCAANIASTDGFTSDKQLAVGHPFCYSAVLLKQIRIYNTALSSQSILNNYIIYRDSVAEMRSAYEKNDLYEAGTQNFDLNKIASVLPVMVITGNIPAIEATTDKKLQITANVQYTNLQDPTKSFTIRNAIITGQGTSSMTYPKKNYRIYTRKSDQTVLLDSNGNPVADRLWSFKEGAQPVDCWCLKTDFAESSGTHNTGVARLWNDVLMNTQVDDQYVLRTDAQKAAVQNHYEYDVRTTVDGFPIVVFYHLAEEDSLIFLGKFNFNNDKSTESVFGFKDLYVDDTKIFDASNVQCFEFLDSGNALALFQTMEGFDSNWDKAWESRYPDTKNPNLNPLRTLATWLVSTYGADPDGDASAQAKFAEWQAHKADHFDLPKLASYYVYLMRFGAVDQTVKNSMLMTEDGVHWFFILYDNDTILGVRNDGLLRYGPDIDRQTQDAEIGGYAYAGHGATIWNNFEADPECMALAKVIDSALYSAGLTYANVIRMFNELQAGKWCEAIYNQDAQYKYIGPYVNEGLNYLGSLQGSRADHRKWWLSTRFALQDALNVNAAYQGKAITLLIPGAQQNTSFSITAGKDFYYGFGENNIVLESGVLIHQGYSRNMYLTKNMEIGSPLRIYAPYYIQQLILNNFIEYIGAANFNLAAAYDEALGTKMRTLVLGVLDPSIDQRRNTALTALSGIDRLVKLEELNVAGYEALLTLDLSNNVNMKIFKGRASGLTSVTFAQGAPLTTVELPAALQVLAFRGQTELQASGLVLEDNGENIYRIDIRNTPNLTNTPTLLLNWIDNKLEDDENCEVYMDNVVWNNISESDILKIAAFKANGGSLTLRGRATMGQIGTVELAEQLMAAFGNDVFNPESAFYIDAPAAMFLSGPSEVLEGENAQYRAIVIGGQPGGTTTWEITSGSRTGTSLNADTGVLTTAENGSGDTNLTIRAAHVSGQQVSTKTLQIQVKNRTYPSAGNVSISGPDQIEAGTPAVFEVVINQSGITGDMTAAWTLSGDLASYASITSQNNNGCVISMPNAPAGDVVSGTLRLDLTKTATGASVVSNKTISIAYVNDTIAVSRYTNPEAFTVLKNAGLCASADYMTKVEAALVSDNQLGTLFRDKQSIVSFDEFRFFTSITSLSDRAFSGCRNLTSITLPSSVTTIGNYAFSGCSNLTSITLPSSVTKIFDYAFASCSNLTSITIGSGVTDIGQNLFYNCISLVSITVESGNTSYFSQDNCVVKRSNSSIIAGCKTSVVGGFATRIAQLAFTTGSCPESINIGSTISYIERQAFYNCSELKHLIIGSGVTNIFSDSFYQCNNIESIVVSEFNTSYNDGNNSNCVINNSNTLVFGCKNTIIPNTVTTIGESAFNYRGLTSITIPSSVTTIGRYAFYNNSNLTSCTIENSSCTIGEGAFTGTHCNETVTVTASTDQQGVTAEGQVITINGTNYTVPESGVVSAQVLYGTNYSISGNAKTGYKSPAVQSFQARQATRSVNVQWKAKTVADGIYIYYTDGTTSNYDSLTAGKTPVGVLISAGDMEAILHPNEGASKLWSANTSTQIPGVTTANDKTNAKKDYAGAANTDAVIASGLAGSAFTFAKTDCVYADGRTGYLPACGEMEQIRLNVANINTALGLIGGDTLDFSTRYYWSSTQYNYSYAWLWRYDLSDWSYYTKYNNTRCRSVSAL